MFRIEPERAQRYRQLSLEQTQVISSALAQTAKKLQSAARSKIGGAKRPSKRGLVDIGVDQFEGAAYTERTDRGLEGPRSTTELVTG